MNIEKMIYVYLVICVGMILFNIISAFLSRRKDKRIVRVSNGFEDSIRSELAWLETHDDVHGAHKNYLAKKLKRISNMRAFDTALEKKYLENPELVKKYLYSIGSIFVSLAIEYSRRDSMEAAYFPYIIKKYRILANRPFDAMIDSCSGFFMNRVSIAGKRRGSLYCRRRFLHCESVKNHRQRR